MYKSEEGHLLIWYMKNKIKTEAFMLAFTLESAIREIHVQNPRNWELCVALVLWSCILKTPNSNLEQSNDSEVYFSQSSQMLGLYLEKDHSCLLPNLYLFTIHNHCSISFLIYTAISSYLSYAMLNDRTICEWVGKADVACFKVPSHFLERLRKLQTIVTYTWAEVWAWDLKSKK
jgi:hypothetical protein